MRHPHSPPKSNAWIEFVLTMTQRVLAFAFLFVLRDAFLYYRKFLSDVTFDNAFVTLYFRHVDARSFSLDAFSHPYERV